MFTNVTLIIFTFVFQEIIVVTSIELQKLFNKNKQNDLKGRFIHNDHILPIINSYHDKLKRTLLGESVLKKSIYKLEIGKGKIRVLMWSQMHGNESTTTKVIFDLINTLINEETIFLKSILEACTICIIPILNPDGAIDYMRQNANGIDLNRDAQALSQPESLILNTVFHQFKPDYCFNLHGQRTIFGVGESNKPATISFLVPAQDKKKSLTQNRITAMELVVIMNNLLQTILPGQVGIYDDTFNINCVGDTFQSRNVPTILFEAGHFGIDYQREFTRELMYCSILKALLYIAGTTDEKIDHNDYFNIPHNQKSFYDIILRDAFYNGKIQDLAIQYEEVLENNRIKFYPHVKKIGELKGINGHREIPINKNEIELLNKDSIEGIEVIVVDKISEKISLKLKEF